MADEIGTVRVELIADPSGIKRGIEEAGGALQRFAAVGTAVGQLIAQAFTEIASRMTEMVQGLIDGSSELFQHLDNNSRQAVRLIGRSFAIAVSMLCSPACRRWRWIAARWPGMWPGISSARCRLLQIGQSGRIVSHGASGSAKRWRMAVAGLL